MNFKARFSDDNDKIFSIVFTLKLTNKEFQLEIDSIAHFVTIESINEDFKNSPFLKINAPAIVYPYLRTFVSTLILNMGFSPVILPTVNFVAMNKQTEKNN